MKTLNHIIAALASGIALSASAADWDVMPDTWVTDDEIGRTVASSDGGVERTDIDPEATVGMFYYVWHGFHAQKNDKDITEILDEDVDNPQWGDPQVFHWGSTPWLGRYGGADKYKTAKHFQMLLDAGVDFIVLDFTNAFIYDDALKALMNEYDRREKLGLRNLKICAMLHANSTKTLEQFYKKFILNKPENEKYWYRWLGKPLLLTNLSEFQNETSEHHDEMAEYFTMRDSWAWQMEEQFRVNEWSWLEFYPQNPGFRVEKGKRIYEQISVGVAQHATTKIGKSSTGHTKAYSTPRGKNPNTPKGLYFQQQWDRALEVHPPVAMVTQFNEWIAQRFVINDESQFGSVRPGANARIGETYFVDVYTPEFSRDLEPSRSPDVRDNYYLQLVSNVRRFKGVHKIPEPKVAKTINIYGDFSQWDEVDAEYVDEPGDVEYTSADAQRPGSLLRPSNDIVRCKVTKDDNNYYFYAETAAALSDMAASDYWMRLFLNTDCDYTTGWGGYDFMAYKDDATGKYSLMKSTSKKNFKWSVVTPLDIAVHDNKLMLAVPRSLIETVPGDTDIDFKWADNFTGDKADVMSFISDGEAAPNGRFNYRYKGSKLSAGSSGIVSLRDAHPGISVRTAGSDTIFCSDNGTPLAVDVYDMTGRTIATRTSSVSLQNGVYIARDNDKVVRFCVR